VVGGGFLKPFYPLITRIFADYFWIVHAKNKQRTELGALLFLTADFRRFLG
jgi:hypothetical protein